MKKFTCAFLVNCLFFSGFFHAQARPIPVAFGLYVKELQVDFAHTSFQTSFYWWLRFPTPADTAVLRQLQQLDFVNGTLSKFEVTETRFTAHRDTVYVTGVCAGSFLCTPDFHHFPFEVQRLPIVLESAVLDTSLVRLVSDPGAYPLAEWQGSRLGLDSAVTVPGFDITGTRFRPTQKVYQTNFGDRAFRQRLAYARLSYEVDLTRQPRSLLLKMLIPNIFILLTAYLVFFVPANRLDVAVGLTVTALLASIALQLTFQTGLPAVGYLTVADKLFYLFYFLITFALVQTIVTYRLDMGKRLVLANHLEIAGRWLYPLMLLTGVWWLVQ
ncbi:MAG: hypothetical protein ACRYFX_17760 [Janthinobacterium lividum]